MQSKPSPALDDFFKEFNKTDWRTEWTFSALQAFAGFWQETERLVATAANQEEALNKPGWIPNNEEESAEYRSIVRAVRYQHDEVITPTFRYAVVVTLFAIFERELRRTADTVAKEIGVPISYKRLRGSVIPHVAQFIKANKGISLQTLPGYATIVDLQKVRDCIVHCFGDIALSRDRDVLTRLSTPAMGLDAYPGTEMEIAPAFIDSALGAHRKFFTALFHGLGWKIKIKWSPKRNPVCVKVKQPRGSV